MKRFVLVICMTVVVFILFACGKGNNDPKPNKTQESKKTGVSGGAGDVSEGAVVPGPDMSDSEIFSRAEELVKNMTLEEKVGQMFLVGVHQLDPSKKGSAKKHRLTKKMKEMLQNYHIGGVCLTERNVKTEQQTKKLISEIQACASGSVMFIAAEEEGSGEHSLAAKLKGGQYTAGRKAAQMASSMTEQQVYEEGGRIARQMITLGFNMNLAPVADIGSERNPAYASRCFGTEVETVSTMVGSMVRGMSDQGMAVTLKYFPGIGNVSGDYEESILDNQDSLMTIRNNNFSVYSDGIAAGADCVMVADTAVSRITVNNKLPAFLSKDIVTDLLREELDFEGVIMTPCLDMKAVTRNYTVEYAVVESVKAGCDLIVMPEDIKKGYDALMDAVAAGRLDEKVINTAVRRILQDKIRRGILVSE